MLTFCREQCTCALFTDPQISFFINFFIKNESHSTIHTFKNYFTTVFSVFSFNKISSIQTDPKLHEKSQSERRRERPAPAVQIHFLSTSLSPRNSDNLGLSWFNVVIITNLLELKLIHLLLISENIFLWSV